MQQVRPNREPIPQINSREKNNAPALLRTDLSSILNEYTSTQKRYNDRLESLERELASLKSHVHTDGSSTSSSDEHELNRTFTVKKPPVSQPVSARSVSSSRIPLPVTPRKSMSDNAPVIPGNIIHAASRPLPPVPLMRSKTFHNDTSHSPLNQIDEAHLLRSYKSHLEQVFHKDPGTHPNIKIPNYTCIDDLFKANEQLLTENDRLRSDLNRLKTESIVLLRSMKTAAGTEPNLGNERILAERERQELTMELARQVEENKRLRKSLLAQSEKFLALRESTNVTNTAVTVVQDHRGTPVSAPHSSLHHSKVQQSRSARYNMGNSRGMVRAKSFHQTSQDPS